MTNNQLFSLNILFKSTQNIEGYKYNEQKHTTIVVATTGDNISGGSEPA